MIAVIKDPTIAFVLYLLLQVADTFTTIKALARGGREANPVVAFMMRRFGKHGWVVVKGAVGLAAGVILLETGAVLMLWLLCAAYFWVVINNNHVGA